MISAAMRSTNRSAVQDQVTQIATGVRALLGEYDDYSGIDNSIIFAAIGISPRNPYGGEYSLSYDASDPRQFIVTIGGLNKSDCHFFKTKAWTDSIGFQMSDGRNSGAESSPANCDAPDGKNSIRIAFN
jgi:hypothetical protein